MDHTTTSFEQIIRNCMDRIFQKLGGGFKESVYQNALAHELRTLGYNVSKEVNISILYENVEVGVARLDILVEDKYIIEFKAIQKLGEKERNQIKRYLRLTENEEGYLINVNLERYEVLKISI